MRAKKVLGFVLAGTMTAALMGCGGNGGNTGEKKDSGKSESSQASEDEINLTFWHIWPDAEMSEIVDSYVDQFEEEHPNVHIEAVATQEVEYQNNKLKVAAATGSQGDVFVCWGGGYAKNYVDAGNVLQLDELMEKNNTKDELLDGTLTYGTYDDKVYGLPLKQWAGALFCNEELFEEYNVKIPETYEDLLQAVKAFRAEDVTPMALGAKDGWHIGMIQNALAVRTEGADYMNLSLIHISEPTRPY